MGSLDMKAMIFAAGLGTRLKPITDTIPKALVPVGGVPMLERVIRKLKGAGMEEIVVNAHHFAERIVDFLKEHPELSTGVSVSLENGTPLETGGGIKHAAPLLGKGRFLVHNVDILSDADLRQFISVDHPDSLATLLLADTPADRCLLFDDGMRLSGWMNIRTGEVKSPLPNFDPSAYRRYSFCGIHIISDRVFALMESWPDNFPIIDFYLANAASETIRGVVAEDIHLIDIGSPEKLDEANRLVGR